jgi:hypothetical protein
MFCKSLPVPRSVPLERSDKNYKFKHEIGILSLARRLVEPSCVVGSQVSSHVVFRVHFYPRYVSCFPPLLCLFVELCSFIVFVLSSLQEEEGEEKSTSLVPWARVRLFRCRRHERSFSPTHPPFCHFIYHPKPASVISFQLSQACLFISYIIGISFHLSQEKQAGYSWTA